MSLHMKDSCPSFNGATSWIGLNTNITLQVPSIVFFWSISCPACIACFPSISRWLDQYAHVALNIIAVHSPRLSTDYDVEQVEEIFLSKNLSISCAIDNNGTLKNDFQTQNIWPYYFLFDDEGKLRSRAAGGMGVNLFENALKRLCTQIVERQKITSI